MWLEVKDIRVHYEKIEVLKGVSIELEEGGIIALVGANGAGKTTLLRVISGLKRATSGQIWFDGRRIDKAPPEKIVTWGIAHVPEGRRIFPYMTVYENLKMGAYIRRDRKEVGTDLERVYDYFPVLKGRARQQGRSLSGGEQQMLAIGRALMTRARLILMDEPSLGLSPLMVKTIGQIISDINRKERVSILLVEQNTNMALRLARWGYVLERGRVTLQGESKNLANDEQVKKAYLGG
jgi:branched-chain amino acid transport system ATP-binding protein